MAIKFFIVWTIVPICVFGFTYFVPRQEKKTTIGWTGKILLSFAVAAILIGIVMLVNNLSGV